MSSAPVAANGSAEHAAMSPAPLSQTLTLERRATSLTSSNAWSKSRSYRRLLGSFLFRYPKIDVALNIIDTALALWSSASFVWQSYITDTPELVVANASTIAAIEIADFCTALFYTLIFAKDFILAISKRDFFLSIMTWTDIVTTIPNLVTFAMTASDLNTATAEAASNLSFLRFFRVLKVLRLNRVNRSSTSVKPSGLIRSQITELVLTMIATLVIFSGTFQMIEQAFVSAEADANRRHGRLDFIDAIYFTISTVATVGFGDVNPISVPGKGVVIVLLLFIITVVSEKITMITTMMSKQSSYERMAYSYSAPHVIIGGNIDTAHLETFLRELLHKDHRAPGEKPIRAVVIAPRDPDAEMVNVVTNVIFSDRVTYINGNLLDEDDMMRARAHKAKAMFIFCSLSKADPQRSDSEVLLQSMALLSFTQKQQMPMPRIIALVHFSLTLRRFQAIMSKSNVGHQVVCMEEVKPALMVQGCINPGFSALAYSIIRSFSITEVLANHDFSALPPWQREFISGMDFELYNTTLPSSFCGVSFAAAAAMLFAKLRVFLIAVEVDGDTQLAPPAYIFTNVSATVHVLADSASHALQVSTISPPELDAADQQAHSGGSPQLGRRRSMLEVMQNAAQKVAIGASVTNELRRRYMGHDASADKERPAAPAVANLKEMSSYWKKLRGAVRIGAAISRGMGSSSSSKDAYQFLLQSDRNPRFARLEAKKTFLILDEDVPLECARVAQYEGFDHIVFCCKSDSVPGALAGSLKRFIAPLRAKSCVFVHTPIVILTLSMDKKDFEFVAMYPSVFVVIGNPLLMQDLRRAGIMSAKFAVVCSHFLPHIGNSDSEDLDSTAADTAAMFAGNLIRKLNSAVCVVAELQYSRSVKFIGNTPNENHEISLATASGRYISNQYFHVLMCRCFYASYSLSLLQELLRPQPTFLKQSSPELSNQHSYSTSIMSSVLVTPNFLGCTFGEIFKACASIGVPVALYRACTISNAADERYLVCCPAPTMRLNLGDQIIMLSPLPPKDIQLVIGKLSDFKSGLAHHAGEPAAKWQAIYDSIDSTKTDESSLSSESLLVQLVDMAGRKIRDLRSELNIPIQPVSPESPKFSEPASPSTRHAALSESGRQRSMLARSKHSRGEFDPATSLKQ